MRFGDSALRRPGSAAILQRGDQASESGSLPRRVPSQQALQVLYKTCDLIFKFQKNQIQIYLLKFEWRTSCFQFDLFYLFFKCFQFHHGFADTPNFYGMYKDRVKVGGLAVLAAAMLMACIVVVLSLTSAEV